MTTIKIGKSKNLLRLIKDNPYIEIEADYGGAIHKFKYDGESVSFYYGLTEKITLKNLKKHFKKNFSGSDWIITNFK